MGQTSKVNPAYIDVIYWPPQSKQEPILFASDIFFSHLVQDYFSRKPLWTREMPWESNLLLFSIHIANCWKFLCQVFQQIMILGECSVRLQSIDDQREQEIIFLISRVLSFYYYNSGWEMKKNHTCKVLLYACHSRTSCRKRSKRTLISPQKINAMVNKVNFIQIDARQWMI